MAAESKASFTPRERWLNFALILGPAAWVLHLNVSYGLVPESCGDGTKLLLHAVTAGCVLLDLIAAAIAAKIRAAADSERTRWIATLALLLSLSMVVVILAQQIPNVMLRSCD